MTTTSSVCVVHDALVEVVQPDKLLVDSLGDLASSFQVVNFLIQLNFGVVISEHLIRAKCQNDKSPAVVIIVINHLENIVGINHGIQSLGNVSLDSRGLVHPLSVILLGLRHVIKLR